MAAEGKETEAKAGVETYLTPDIMAYLGHADPPMTPIDIEKWPIRRFADAIEDDNLLYLNEKYAKESVYGANVAPPTLMGQNTPSYKGTIVPVPVPHQTGLAGDYEWDFIRPMRVGDTITAQMRIADMYEKRGKLGLMVFIVRETTYTNQNGELCAIGRMTRIRY